MPDAWSLFLAYLDSCVAEIIDVFTFFTTAPVVWFTAMAFVAACIGVARKLVPMKRAGHR